MTAPTSGSWWHGLIIEIPQPPTLTFTASLSRAGGGLYGGNIAICTAAEYQYNPSVAYDSANQRFLVAWEDYRNSATTGYDIYGQLITAVGGLYSVNITICTAADDQYSPSVAYDSANQRFLVAWSGLSQFRNYRLLTFTASWSLPGGPCLAETLPSARQRKINILL